MNIGFVKNMHMLNVNCLLNSVNLVNFSISLNYDKHSKISNTVLCLSSNKMWVTRAGIYKMLARIANREDPDQTASSEAV